MTKSHAARRVLRATALVGSVVLCGCPAFLSDNFRIIPDAGGNARDSGYLSDASGNPGLDSGTEEASESGSSGSGSSTSSGSGGSGADGSSASSSGGSSSSGSDASTCIAVAVTPPPAHGGPACPMGDSGCNPQDVTAFSANWAPPIGHNLGRCTAAQINDYYDQCLSTTATGSGCSAWTNDTNNVTCFGCLVTPNTARQWGPVVQYGNGGEEYINSAGCVWLAEPCNLACATALESLVECESAACATCDVPTDPNSYMSCASEARQMCGCTGYYSSTNCVGAMAQTPAQHPAFATCFGGTLTATFEQLYLSVATYMCGF